jgi:hypothetical protein
VFRANEPMTQVLITGKQFHSINCGGLIMSRRHG